MMLFLCCLKVFAFVCVFMGLGKRKRKALVVHQFLEASWCLSSELENSHKHKAACLLTYRATREVVVCLCVCVCVRFYK